LTALFGRGNTDPELLQLANMISPPSWIDDMPGAIPTLQSFPRVRQEHVVLLG
jgi:hypothetical protein